jgi:hypothetical protein
LGTTPLGIEPFEGALRLAYDADEVLPAAMVLAATVSLVARFRRTEGTEREQLEWFLTARAFSRHWWWP